MVDLLADSRKSFSALRQLTDGFAASLSGLHKEAVASARALTSIFEPAIEIQKDFERMAATAQAFSRSISGIAEEARRLQVGIDSFGKLASIQTALFTVVTPLTNFPLQEFFDEQRRATEYLNRLMQPLTAIPDVLPEMAETLRLFQRPATPQLERRSDGRPNYIEYLRALQRLPDNGFWAFERFHLEVLFGPGSIRGDLWLLSDDRIKPEQRFQAARRFVARYIALRLADPATARGLRLLIGQGVRSRQDLLEYVLPELVLRSVDECDRHQRVRRGTVWIKSKRGRRKEVRPVELEFEKYAGWLRQRVYAKLCDMVRVESMSEIIYSDGFNPLAALTAAESGCLEQPGRMHLFEDWIAQLPRVQRKYVRALFRAFADCQDVAEARKRAAKSLKIKSSYERQLFSRLKRTR